MTNVKVHRIFLGIRRRSFYMAAVTVILRWKPFFMLLSSGSFFFYGEAFLESKGNYVRKVI